MPLLKPKGVVENYHEKRNFKPHFHNCPKCKKDWPCSLEIDPESRDEWVKKRINAEKIGLNCWWDDNPTCGACEAKP